MIARQLYNPPAELKKKSDYINLSVQTIADFNNKLDQLNLSSDKIQFKAELEELKKVTEFALGIIEGLKTKNLHEIDLTTSYGRGVACGTFTSSLTSKVSSLLGCTGGVVGYVSSQPWLLVAGAVTALSCFIADAGITVCLSKDVNEKTEQLKNVKVFANDMQKMENPEISGIEYQQGELHGYEVFSSEHEYT